MLLGDYREMLRAAQRAVVLLTGGDEVWEGRAYNHRAVAHLALGAATGQVLGRVVRQGFVLAAIGLAIGAAGSLAVTRMLGSMLFEVKPGDPITLIGVTLLLMLVAFAACYIPARRASRVDPLVALRHE